MKRNETKTHQNTQADQKDKAIIKVRSDLRAGLTGSRSNDVCI